MRGAFAYLVALLQLAPAQPHAVMKTPTPRPASGMQNTGTKLQPFNAAQSYADGGCGGSTNGDPGVQQPTIAFQSGAQVTVTWELTIPHPADNLDSGIRIAVHYGPGDSFAQNILAGGVINSGQPNTVSADLLTTTVQLPAGKVSDYATIQWVWSANQDGGSYIGCADVAITANGALPTNYVPNARQGEVLSGVAATATGPGSIVQPSPPPPPPQGGNVGSGNNQGAPSGDGGNSSGPGGRLLDPRCRGLLRLHAVQEDEKQRRQRADGQQDGRAAATAGAVRRPWPAARLVIGRRSSERRDILHRPAGRQSVDSSRAGLSTLVYTARMLAPGLFVALLRGPPVHLDADFLDVRRERTPAVSLPPTGDGD